jgi:hypothetical protein
VGGLLDEDVGDLELVNVEGLELSVGLCVLEQVQQELAGLGGVATLGARELLVHLGLGVTANSTLEATEGNHLLVLLDVLKELLGLAERHALDVVGSLTGVLEVNTEIRAAGLAG